MKIINFDLSTYGDELINIIQYKTPYLSEDILEVKNENGILSIVSADNEPGLENKVRDFITELASIYESYKPVVVYRSKATIRNQQLDIFNELKKQGWIIQFENGFIGVQKKFLELINYIDGLIQTWAQKYNALEYYYPELIDIETLKRCNYLTQLPEILYFASTLKNNVRVINSFSKLAHSNDCFSSDYLTKPAYVHKPAVCLHVYKQFQDQQIDINSPLVITSVGRCLRNESKNVKKIERLFNFTMREIVFIGAPDFVLSIREQLMELSKQLIDKLGLVGNIKTSNDMFFTSEYEQKAIIQQKFKLKYELNVLLPFDKKEISVGSFNYHGSFFTNSFNIKGKNDEIVHTGCVGFGLERFVYAYLSQVGLREGYEMVKRSKGECL